MKRFLVMAATGAGAVVAVLALAVPGATQASNLAVDDESLDNPIGASVLVDVLANDDPSLRDQAASLVRPGFGSGYADFHVDGEGQWRATNNGIRFVPDAEFTGNPTPQRYSVTNDAGEEFFATITITFTQGGAPTTTTTAAAPSTPPELALTGADTTALLLLAVSFIALGVGLCWLQRRVPADGSRAGI